MQPMTCRRVIEAMHLTLVEPVVVLMDRRTYDELRADALARLTMRTTSEKGDTEINGVPLVLADVLGCWFVYPNHGSEPKLRKIEP